MTALSEREHAGSGTSRDRPLRRRVRREQERQVPVVFWVIAVIAMGVLLIPVAVVVLAALNAGTYLTFPPQGFSLRWVVHFLTTRTFRSAYLFSLQLALITTIVATVLGTCSALFLTRVWFRGRSLVRAYFMAPLMLPWLVLGLALYTFYVTTNIGFARTLPGRSLALEGLLKTILANALRLSRTAVESAEAAAGRHRLLVTRFRELIETAFREGWSLADYAAALNVSQSRLRNAC